MKKFLGEGILVLAVAVGAIFGQAAVATAAEQPYCAAGASCLAVLTVSDGASTARGAGVPTQLTGTGGVFTSVVNVLLFVIGAVAVIMIIIGGIRYVTSNGDQTHVKAAKDTIMYSIIGLVVAILAYAIVQFIVSNIHQAAQ